MAEMTLKSQSDLDIKTYENGNGLSVNVLPNGGVQGIRVNDMFMGQLLGNPLEGGLSAVYLRKYTVDGIKALNMIAPASGSSFCADDAAPSWCGEWESIRYCCRLVLSRETNVWFWRVDLESLSDDDVKVDVINAQDVGIASLGALRSNEAYACQYIDHMAVQDDTYGAIILSRQNQEQSGNSYPWLMQGCLQGAKSFVTDGFDFFGLSYKVTGVPEALAKETLGDIKRQYEFAYVCLQSETQSLAKGEKKHVMFFGLYEPTHPEASCADDIKRMELVKNAASAVEACACEGCGQTVETNVFNTAPYVAVESLSEEDVFSLTSADARHVERSADGALLSFIYGREKYVVTPGKEMLSERPHGHILRSGTSVFPDNKVMCSTNYMYGIFNAQVVIGNTSFSKLLSVPRNALNVTRVSGQRIFVEQDGEWRLLGVPSLYEIGISVTRWIYKLKTGTITVKTCAGAADSVIITQIDVTGDPVKLLISGEVAMGGNEYESKPCVEIDQTAKSFMFRPDPNELISQRQPETKMYLVTAEPEKVAAIGGDELLFDGAPCKGYPYAVLETEAVNSFSFVMTGSVEKSVDADALAQKYSRPVDFDAEVAGADEFWDSMMNRSSIVLENEKIHRLHDITKWYVHNAMIHYTVPHGLEQYGGAAWGTRDVCQGPVEFLLSYGKTSEVADILKMVFKHQYVEDGTWPQWFMFLEYSNIQHHHCHGDIIIWPLKALCDYLETSNDASILDVKSKYTTKEGYTFTDEEYTVAEHVEKLIGYIESEFIDDTALICYGDGDWDDTLQPADSTMRTRMVSGWTAELVYQTFRRYQKISAKLGNMPLAERLETLADKMREDFNTHVIKDGVVSGFVYFDEETGPRSLLHPTDDVTDIQYRLLPMTRGIISEMFTPEQSKQHREIIRENLAFPDGVHLMNRAVKYNGGTQKYFRRAETASNFGREIGLQYVHAHIRYIEAVAKLGEADELLKALLTICPLKIQETVPNAMTRQSNAYFSSSDGAFLDRYEAVKRYGDLKEGKEQVKGGWRIYSSGPGIYINQLVSNFLGIRFWMDSLVLDPVIPNELNGLAYQTELDGRTVKFNYHVEKQNHSPNRIVVNGTEMGELEYSENLYRQGGAVLPRDKVMALLSDEGVNSIDVYL